MSQPLRLIRTNVVPPGGFKYFQPETKFWIHAGNIEALERAVVGHRQANHLPVGTDIRAEIEQQICEPLGSEWCNNSNPSPSLLGLTFSALVQGTKTIIDWALNGAERVDNEEANRRGTICATGGSGGKPCQFNQDGSGCTGCNTHSLTEMVARIVVNGDVPADKFLKQCAICGCNLKAKTRIPILILHRHMTDKQQNDLPDYCWSKKTELKAA